MRNACNIAPHVERNGALFNYVSFICNHTPLIIVGRLKLTPFSATFQVV